MTKPKCSWETSSKTGSVFNNVSVTRPPLYFLVSAFQSRQWNESRLTLLLEELCFCGGGAGSRLGLCEPSLLSLSLSRLSLTGGGKGQRSATHRHNTSGALWGNADWMGRPHPGFQKFTLFLPTEFHLKQRFSTGGARPKSGSRGCFNCFAASLYICIYTYTHIYTHICWHLFCSTHNSFQ